ncbi:restriction endonuclease subunit S [Bacteroides cellulosilyticus]|uniref:Type I restriction endonuclease n=4 Tax=Bacteroides cellulosilyticus TaxID=246787 RepID=A0A642PVK7_9BACE|nr:restriction endonuclease subunit S [Bacteroides cellulosilyticus]KAA5417479.1 type I restriction endonuclease [Bacteroides cellulosilyticus]MCB6592610.1 restriction endonuclease subunit S [Bacteroides cellulosilyticus]UVP50387.1 restriction endonuclease subunit S [Bacteroides cellulosilyticus]
MDTKKLRQKILDLAIHGKLVPQDPNDEPASVLLERIKAEKERLIKEGKIKRSKKSGSSDTLHYENVPFEVPSSWVWCRLEDITVLIEDCPHTTAKDEGKGYPLVRTPNIGEGQLLLDGVHRVSKEVYDKRNVRAVPQVDDIIYAREAPAGNVAVIRENEQVCLGQRTVLIRPMNTLIDSVWLTYAMLTPYSRNHLISKATGSTVTHVNMASIRPFDLPLPPLSEQHRIVAEIKRWFALIDQIEQGKADLQTIIKQTKSKILDLAIHGKLVPQDPNDEPAIELLKRINPDFTPCDNEHSRKLPQNWCICRLKDLCSFLSRGKSPKYSENDKTYPVFAQKCNFKDGGISLEQARFLDPSTICKWSETYKLRTGDILVNSTGTGTVGRTRLFHESYLGQYPFVVPDSHVSVIRVIDDIIPQYLYAYISSSFIQRYLQDNLAGSTNQKELYIGVLENLVIFVPPFIEQQRIVQKIEELFTSIDEIQKALEV